MNNLPIDINCDMGESLGNSIIGQDEKLMPFITSCNIACGFHGGNPLCIQKTILLAIKYKVRIGAHPSYPDLEGFGRRKMSFEHDELNAIITYQIAALKGMVESLGGKLNYVKPHGALYNKASVDVKESEIIIEAIQSIDKNLAFMGLAGSVMETTAKEKGIKFITEAFCDRRYERQGTLMSRQKPEAVFSNVHDVVRQVKSIVFDKKVKIDSTQIISINADSICVHGDNPMALEFLMGIQKMLKSYQNEN